MGFAIHKNRTPLNLIGRQLPSENSDLVVGLTKRVDRFAFDLELLGDLQHELAKSPMRSTLVLGDPSSSAHCGCLSLPRLKLVHWLFDRRQVLEIDLHRVHVVMPFDHIDVVANVLGELLDRALKVRHHFPALFSVLRELRHKITFLRV
jgi:hypothetical protein